MSRYSSRSRFALALFTFLLLFNGRQRAVQHPSAWPFNGPSADIWSYAEPASVTTRHLSLDLTVDFQAQQLRGSATLEIENRTGTRTLVLDTYQLAISRVTLDGGTVAAWSLGLETRIGAPLRITIEPTTRFVTIEYATDPLAPPQHDAFGSPLQWTPASETTGKQQPFLFTVACPVGTRSWVPLQDTPTVRMSYDATLRVPSGLLAVMSAADNPTSVSGNGVYTFHMPYPIPAYLIAFGVGRLAYRPLDERTGVYAEPELLNSAAQALQPLPEMVDAAESFLGPLPFPHHDILLMPPTFFAEGMENPMLNFLLASEVLGPNPESLVAHELAHAWAGDSTTLSTWNDIWLNEGGATYLAHRILEVLHGSSDNEWAADVVRYRSHLKRVDEEETVLHRQVESPLDGFSLTSYLKGALFLNMLENHAGRENFDRFLRTYFQSARWWWVDDRKFLSTFREIVRPDASLEQQMRIDEWLYGTGLPSNVTGIPLRPAA